jgi:HD-GYP domain-containing protein (c-di-GMP phosphodiesterase class II)
VKHLYYIRPSPLAENLDRLANTSGDYAVAALDRQARAPLPWEMPAVVIVAAEDDLARLEKMAPEEDWWRVIYLVEGESAPSAAVSSSRVFALVPQGSPRGVLEKAIEQAFESLVALEERQQARRDLETLNQIGIALSAERNTEELLNLILKKSREITASDAGSLYVVEVGANQTRHLVFKLTQNDSREAPFREEKLPINEESMAGYAAATGKVRNIEDAHHIHDLPFRFNPDFDRRLNYRTKSVLVVPMKNQQGEVIGVLQLINAKKHAAAKLVSAEVVEAEVIPFSKRSQELAESLASQAAVVLENNLLSKTLFEGFVKASVTAIESRDPATFGHSERVEKLTVGLAQAADRVAKVHFSPRDMQELRYAALLHDFGKVGVREDILVKAKKLYPLQLDLIRKRFLYVRKAAEATSLEKKLDYVLRHGGQDYHDAFARIDGERDRNLQTLDEFLQTIEAANEPSVLAGEVSSKLAEIAGFPFGDGSGAGEPLLVREELHLLSIARGTLDDEERRQIESHVEHSYSFLKQIPWTKELKNIPEIARFHHEKLDGSGYPDHLKGAQIPAQVRMVTISDMYDALTATDRPYKPAVSPERALDIIGREVKSNLLDPVLFRLFVEAKIYELTARR